MTIAVLATGDEIIHGDTLNTNSQQIAHALHSQGLSIGMHMACSDEEKDMVSCLHYLMQAHDTIILTGGLGPTSDDRTRFALSRALDIPLIEYPQAVKHIEDRLKAANVAFTQGNYQQALFPKGAYLLPNPHGSAVGCQGVWKGKQFILLPGPPKECLPMLNNYVIPFLEKERLDNQELIKWLIFGFAESELADLLEKALEDIDCQIGYRLDVPYVEFKVRCRLELVDKVKSRIDPLIGEFIIAPAGQKASFALREKIARLQQPLTLIDEVTGGLMQYLLQRPQTYSFLRFHETKTPGPCFKLTGLKAYWQGKNPGGKCEIAIHYSNKKGAQVIHHEAPYRSSHVLQYSAEWLCFRLAHLIDELHE